MSLQSLGRVSAAPSRAKAPARFVASRALASRRPPSRNVVVAFLDDHKNHKGDHHTHHSKDPLSVHLFVPYKHLPADGLVCKPEDAVCDPAEHKCKSIIYTYETKCHACYGTGFVKGHSNGRRASLGTCLVCLGLGYVRHTTARFAPDAAKGAETMTIARPQLDPGLKAQLEEKIARRQAFVEAQRKLQAEEDAQQQ
ncbi:hypothetical protein HYH02_009732 [Chlamydomonas schloesseri]|uniref:Uncharacterized protein n=1 Tax=Chlamydomonas schloesseri TaxID=2026947 RepID=A0A835TF45_9CHLO|nr:hypothetical protein HYH02_009732 [Chlamydomonas schloesseri]|eukprot:KAG2442248.1 hypothetical protein HYH02_009732 [Chlamydomonas schloesseri]